MDNPGFLPPVVDEGPLMIPDINSSTPDDDRPKTADTVMFAPSERIGSHTTIGSRASAGTFFIGSNFNRFRIDDLTSYTMTDQRWTLQRKKIGLQRKTIGAKKRKFQNDKHIEMNLNFIKSFTRKECIKYVVHPQKVSKEVCYCGLPKREHKPLPPPPPLPSSPGITMETRAMRIRHEVDQRIQMVEIGDLPESAYTPMDFRQPPTIAEEGDEGAVDATLPLDHRRESNGSRNFQRRGPIMNDLLSRHVSGDKIAAGGGGGGGLGAGGLGAGGLGAGGLGAGGLGAGGFMHESKLELNDDDTPKDGNEEWSVAECIEEYPTNAYGMIDFINETSGSVKPAKYVRVSNSTSIERIKTLLVDYWKLSETGRPSLVISVTGGAKHFKLDGNKKTTFNTGLLKAVRSTNAWLVTGGVNVGVMKTVGEAVNEGQHVIKIKRKNIFSEESVHFVRGIKCLGVAPWGYVKHFNDLINPDPSQFSRIKYKVDEKITHHDNVSLNGDHTHFLLVDNGFRYGFSGADRFRTRLEEAIQMPEPLGLGVPVVVVLLDGGLSSIVKCSMALRSRIPVVVVAGSGRAADLIAYGVSMTHETASGQFVMRKAHKKNLWQRVDLAMEEYSLGKRETCMKMVVQCCHHADLITIFDINSGDDMDKYILYALLKGDGMSSESSRLDQLHLSLLWNRPDIAEQHIFPSLTYWPSSLLEDLMTMALLEEKVSFVKLFIVNGLVMTEYLTVGNLRRLYNDSCQPNGHMHKLLQRCCKAKSYYLKDVHSILVALIGHHSDEIYLADTHVSAIENTSINYYTFEDPYQELFLWAVLSNRGLLAKFLWERCNSPLTSAVVGTVLYRGLWRSLGAKNTELREVYLKRCQEFESLGVQLLEECFAEDPTNAIGLVERRNAKWGELDCLELCLSGTAMNFIASSCCQASVDLNWQRGMVRCPSVSCIFAIFLPFLIWTRLFSFQKIGDDQGELTKFQKLIVFYKTPKVKYFGHSLSFLGFLILYSYVILFDFRFIMTRSEMLVLVWILTYMLEEISELLTQQARTLNAKFHNWWQSVWNRFDTVAFILAVLALSLRISSYTFTYGRIMYAINTTVFYCRLFRIYQLHYSLGPKLVVFYRMISEVVMFMALLVIFILGYGMASQSLLHPSPSRTFDSDSIISTVKQIILTPYWQMYGELLLENLEGEDTQVCHKDMEDLIAVCENPLNYTWVVQFMLIFYLIIGNIMLLNLLIAVFTYVFDEVHENSMEIWKYERYVLIKEYDSKPGLVPPLVILEHIYRLSKWFWKTFIRRKKENLDDYMASTLTALRIFEKEAITSFLSKVQRRTDASLEHKIARISEKIDVIMKFVEREKELQQIEEDLDWATQEAILDEDLIEVMGSPSPPSSPDSPKKRQATSSTREKKDKPIDKPLISLSRVDGDNEVREDSTATVTDSEDDDCSSESDEDVKKVQRLRPFTGNVIDLGSPSHSKKVKFANRAPNQMSRRSKSNSIQRLAVSRRSKRADQRELRESLVKMRQSKQSLKIPTVTKTDSFEDDGVAANEEEEEEAKDELCPELSDEDIEKELDHLKHKTDDRVHMSRSSKRALTPSKKLGGAWDGELHYPSRPTSGGSVLLRSRGGSARGAGQEAAALKGVLELGEKFTELSSNVERNQRHLEELLLELKKQKETKEDKKKK